jgi:hypothetical protein
VKKRVEGLWTSLSIKKEPSLLLENHTCYHIFPYPYYFASSKTTSNIGNYNKKNAIKYPITECIYLNFCKEGGGENKRSKKRNLRQKMNKK